MKLKFKRNINWKFFVVPAVAIAALAGIFLWNLNQVPPSGQVFEEPNYLRIEYLNDLKEDVLFAPHRALGFGLVSLDNAEPVYLRLISVFFAIGAVTAFFLLIRLWISTRVALIATALFASSSWVLFIARSAESESMLLFCVPVLLLAGSYLRDKKFDNFLPITTFLTVACLYVPFVWTFVLAGIGFLFSDLKEAWQEQNFKQRFLWLTGFVLPVVPLAYGLSQNTTLKSWLGVPPEGFSPQAFGDNLISLPSQLFINGTSDVLRWLPATPILDVATIVFMILGIVYVARHRQHSLRRITLIIFSFLSLIGIGLFGSVFISLLLPLVYVFAAFGIAFLMEQWFHVFPRNPFARSFCVVILCTVALLICCYHVARYHYVWPRSHVASKLFQQ